MLGTEAHSSHWLAKFLSFRNGKVVIEGLFENKWFINKLWIINGKWHKHIYVACTYVKYQGHVKIFGKRRSLAHKVSHIYTAKPSKMLIHDPVMVQLTWAGWGFTLGHNAVTSCKVPEPFPRSHPFWKSTTWRIHAARHVCSWTPWRTEILHILVMSVCPPPLVWLVWPMFHYSLTTHGSLSIAPPWQGSLVFTSSECAAARCTANWQRRWVGGGASQLDAIESLWIFQRWGVSWQHPV